MNLFVKAYGIAESLNLMGRPWFSAVYRWTYFKYKRLAEDPFARLCKRYPEMFAGGNVLDVGANIGYTASVFSSAIEDDFHVHAFEPEEGCFKELILEASRSNGRIVALRSAVGETSGSVTVWRNKQHRADHRVVTETFGAHLDLEEERQTVPLICIDEYVEEIGQPVSFIKIDVQGYELAVLKGANRTIEKNQDLVVAFEYSPESMVELGFEPSELVNFFVRSNFKLYLIDRKKDITPLAESELARVRAANCYIDILAVPTSMQSVLRLS